MKTHFIKPLLCSFLAITPLIIVGCGGSGGGGNRPTPGASSFALNLITSTEAVGSIAGQPISPILTMENVNRAVPAKNRFSKYLNAAYFGTKDSAGRTTGISEIAFWNTDASKAQRLFFDEEQHIRQIIVGETGHTFAFTWLTPNKFTLRLFDQSGTYLGGSLIEGDTNSFKATPLSESARALTSKTGNGFSAKGNSTKAQAEGDANCNDIKSSVLNVLDQVKEKYTQEEALKALVKAAAKGSGATLLFAELFPGITVTNPAIPVALGFTVAAYSLYQDLFKAPITDAFLNSSQSSCVACSTSNNRQAVVTQATNACGLDKECESFDLQNGVLVRVPCPTPTATATTTASPSPTATATATPTLTPSPTPTSKPVPKTTVFIRTRMWEVTTMHWRLRGLEKSLNEKVSKLEC